MDVLSKYVLKLASKQVSTLSKYASKDVSKEGILLVFGKVYQHSIIESQKSVRYIPTSIL